MLRKIFRHTLTRIVLVSLFALAITVPFAGQEFMLDEPLMLDFARAQEDEPFRQALEDYDYFGIRFDEFFNTHPRLLSFYLSLVLRLTGDPAPVPVHLSMVIFPVMAGVATFYLGRRFGVSGMAAALLFLAAPAFMVSSHMAMVDVPGTALWLAALAAFIYGVDRDSRRLLVLAGVMFTLTIFVFYQGLAALALAVLYLLLMKRFSIRTLAPVLAPAALFILYLVLFHAAYGELPRFSYRRPHPLYDWTVANQFRTVLTVLGATAMFPLALVAGFWRSWRAGVVFILAAAATLGWSAVLYAQDEYSLGSMILLSLFLPAGILVLYMLLEAIVRHAGKAIRRMGEGKEAVFLVVWALGVLAYNIFLMPYAAPRYILPGLAPAIIVMLFLCRQVFSRRRVLRAAVFIAALFLTLLLSVGLSLAAGDRAKLASEIASWVESRYGENGGNDIWFSGELGFRYYMEQRGYRILPNVMGEDYIYTDKARPVASPKTGDLVATSPVFGNWLAYPETLARMRLVESDEARIHGILVMYGEKNEAAWGAAVFMPYNLNIEPERIERVIIWEIVDEPVPLLEVVVDSLPESVAAGLSEDQIFREGEAP